MKLQKLELTNYRGAENLSINLHPNLNVFIGVNGAGKSTVLDSIVIMLSWVANRIGNPLASGKPILENDITNSQNFSIIKLTAQSINQLQDPITWQLVKGRKGHTIPEKSELTQINRYVQEIRQEISDQDPVNLPLFIYYPVNRAVLDIPLRIKNKHQFNPLAAYKESLSSGAGFRTFFEWFREREDLENENRKYREKYALFYLMKPEGIEDVEDVEDVCVPDPQLEVVRQAIYEFLPDFSNLTVRRNPLRMEVTKLRKTLIVNQLSDGEKCLIAMVGDLARRMAMINPQNPDPLKGVGIIIIDEIELHLHPKWQRFIVPKLLAVFPNCQFFISTHSPHVITHVQPENLHILKQTDQGIEVSSVHESYGKTTERILEDLMGLDTTRPTEVDDALKAIYEKIARNQLVEAKEQINELKKDIPNDSELTKAEVLIRRKEIIGK